MLHDSVSSSSQPTSVLPVLSAVPLHCAVPELLSPPAPVYGGPWAHLFWGETESKFPSRKVGVRLGKGTDLNSRCCHAGGGQLTLDSIPAVHWRGWGTLGMSCNLYQFLNEKGGLMLVCQAFLLSLRSMVSQWCQEGTEVSLACSRKVDG